MALLLKTNVIPISCCSEQGLPARQKPARHAIYIPNQAIGKDICLFSRHLFLSEPSISHRSHWSGHGLHAHSPSTDACTPLSLSPLLPSNLHTHTSTGILHPTPSRYIGVARGKGMFCKQYRVKVVVRRQWYFGAARLLCSPVEQGPAPTPHHCWYAL